MSEYHIHLAILVGIYLILAQSFHLTFGLAGAFNLAHVASYAVGAYTTALLSTEVFAPYCSALDPAAQSTAVLFFCHEGNFLICILASMALSGIFAFSIGAISLRLEADYFAIGTLAFSSLISALLINWKSLTRGVLGIPGIPRPELFGLDFYQNINFLMLVFVLAGGVMIFLGLVFHNSFARKLRAQSEAPQAAMALAVDTRRLKNTCFFISSALAGLAGSLFAYYINYIDPSSFSLAEMVFVLTIVVVGRPGSFRGGIIATFFMVLLPEPLRFIDIPPSVLGPIRQMLYAVILFAVVYINRAKLWPPERKI